MVTLGQSRRELLDVARGMDLVEASTLSKITAFTARSGQVCEVNHHLRFQTGYGIFYVGESVKESQRTQPKLLGSVGWVQIFDPLLEERNSRRRLPWKIRKRLPA